jgi:hypothetical protein
MHKSADSLICLFDKKRREKFTGGIKLGFEQGRLVNCVEYSDPERMPPLLPDDFSLRECFRMACSSGFYGSLLFFFKNGTIRNASSVRTWTGPGIQSLLEESSAGGSGAELP